MTWLDRATARAISRRAPALESKKAPRGAMAVPDWTLPDQPLYEDLDAAATIEKAYLKNVYAFRCVDTIASDIAALPFRAGDPLTEKYRLSHPLAELLGPAPTPPSSMWSAYSLWRYSIAQYVLMGKFAWAIERDDLNRISGLWPLQAQHLKPVPATSGSNYFKKFQYGLQGSTTYTEFRPDQIVYIYRPSLSNFRLPESPAHIAAANINVAKLLDMFDYHFLKNGGVPAYLIVTPPFATEDDRSAFQNQFLSEYGGPANVGRAMFAERDLDPGEVGATPQDSVDVKTIGLSQRDSEHGRLREDEIRAICIAWGVPLSILGDSSHRTFSNAKQERVNYWLQTCLPRIREVQDQVNIHLAPQLGTELGWFDTKGVPELRPEPTIPADQIPNWVLAKLITENEARSMYGLPPGQEVGLDEMWKQKELEMQPGPIKGDSLAAESDPKKEAVVTPAASPAPRSVRHGGHPGHISIPTGHVTIDVLERVLTAQLNMLMDDMRKAHSTLQNGRKAKRGEDVHLDEQYWQDRAIMMLSPTLRGLGLTGHELVVVVTDIVHEAESNDFMPMSAIATAERAYKLSMREVEQALLDLHNGETTIEATMAAWSKS